MHLFLSIQKICEIVGSFFNREKLPSSADMFQHELNKK